MICARFALKWHAMSKSVAGHVWTHYNLPVGLISYSVNACLIYLRSNIVEQFLKLQYKRGELG